MKKVLIIAAAALALTTSCIDQKETATTFKTNEALDTVNVKVKPVFAKDIEQLVEFTANVEADVVNNIAPQSPVRIRKINVEVGDHVSKGQTLVELDNNNLAQMKLALDNLEVEFQRIDELYKVGGVSKSQWDSQKSALEQRREAYKNLEENTRLVSPTSGVVSARNYDNGDLYSGSKPVLVVEKISPVKILLDVNEQYYKDIKVGMPVGQITCDAYPGEVFQGRVSLVYPTIDTNTRTFKVEVQITNNNQRVRPGMFARVTLNFGTAHHVLVPDQAVVKQTGSGERFVYVLRDGKAYHQSIQTGRRIEKEYEVTSGLSDGDIVVVFGQTLLSDGRDVKVLSDVEKR